MIASRSRDVTRPRPARQPAGLAQARRAVVIVEFALMMPLFLVLILGVYDAAALLIVERRLAVAASEVAEIGTNLAIQPDNTNHLSLGYNGTATGTIFSTITTPFAYFPARLTDSSRTYSITLSSISMQPTQNGCTSACSYEGYVAWTMAISNNEPNDSAYPVMQNVNLDFSQERPCSQALTAAAPNPSSVPNTPNAVALRELTAGVLTSEALIVADVSTTYKPMFLSLITLRFITGPVSLFRSGFMPPRVGMLSQFIPVTSSSAGITTCPGYATVSSS